MKRGNNTDRIITICHSNFDCDLHILGIYGFCGQEKKEKSHLQTAENDHIFVSFSGPWDCVSEY